MTLTEIYPLRTNAEVEAVSRFADCHQMLTQIFSFNPGLTCLAESADILLQRSLKPDSNISEIISEQEWQNPRGLTNRFLRSANFDTFSGQTLVSLLTCSCSSNELVKRINSVGIFNDNTEINPWDVMREYEEFKKQIAQE